MAQSSVNKLLKGANGSRKTVEIASVLGVRPEWLSTGQGEMLESGIREANTLCQIKPVMNEVYRVDVLDVKASAGPGSLVTSDFIETIRAIEYTTEQARALFGNRPADNVKVITVNGDSMIDKSKKRRVANGSGTQKLSEEDVRNIRISSDTHEGHRRSRQPGHQLCRHSNDRRS